MAAATDWLKNSIIICLIGGASGAGGGTALADIQITKAKTEVISTVEQKIINTRVELRQEADKANAENKQVLLRIESKLDAVQTELVDLKIATANHKK